jgi:hypothetical protein
MILNGIFRGFYIDAVGENRARLIGLAIGIALTFIFVLFANQIWAIPNNTSAIAIGIMWLILTPIFEFTFGHYVMGQNWEILIQDYNILKGRLWPLYLVTVTITPSIVYQLVSY